MLTGRKQELEYLEEFYRTDRSNIVVLYGREGIGKTTLVSHFIQGKPCIYYNARKVADREQLYCMKRDWPETEQARDYYEVFRKKTEQCTETAKTVLVLDEFRNLLDFSENFAEGFSRFYDETAPGKKLMVVLISSSINWVENEMAQKLGTTAKLIGGFVKLKAFSFMELASYFKEFPVKQDIYAGSVVGGVPGYLRFWDTKSDLEENIKRLFLSEDAPLFAEAERYLKLELRELTAYNTILATMAEGHYKLNEIYEHTGFSRAKISVYLKNLTQLDITEKMFSSESGDNNAALKGLYRIREPYLRFWYRFVYPNLSEIALGNKEKVYREKMRPFLLAYVSDFFSEVCNEYLQLMNRYHRLETNYSHFGPWYGKAGKIDVLAKAEDGSCLAGFCDCTADPLGPEALDRYYEILASAGITKYEMQVFSMAGFTEEFETRATEENVSYTWAKDM